MTFMVEQFLGLVVLTFACYRLACLVAEDVGPWRACEKFRSLFASGWQRQGIECVGCVGFWVSATAVACLAVAGAVPVGYAPTIWLAVSGGICFINRLAPCP